MEVSKAVRTGYFQALTGQIMNGLEAVPIYDVFALSAEVPYPYILLSSQESAQRNVKGCKIYDVTILIDIVTGSQQVTGRDQAETLADQIELIVNPDDDSSLNIEANGYQIGDTYRRSDSDQGAKNGTYYIYRKLMRYEHSIAKL